MKNTVQVHLKTPTTPANEQVKIEARTNTVRTIKIEQLGDYYKNKVVPFIRLKGKWLWLAGFTAGNHVQIVLHETGRMEIVKISSDYAHGAAS